MMALKVALAVVVAMAVGVVVIGVVADAADIALGACRARGDHRQGQRVGRTTQDIRDAVRCLG